MAEIDNAARLGASSYNASIKATADIVICMLTLVKAAIDKIPDPSVQNVMRKDLEKGNVRMELFDRSMQDDVRKALSDAGLKEGKDYILHTYHELSGDVYTALFYNVKDADIIEGTKKDLQIDDEIKKGCYGFAQKLKEAGIDLDATVDLEAFDAYCKSKGVQFDFSKTPNKDDFDYAMKLISSEFSQLSDQQKKEFAYKACQSGLIDELDRTKTFGLVTKQTLYNTSKENGKPSVMKIECSDIGIMAIADRAKAYGIRVAEVGPNSQDKTYVAFAEKDEAVMRRVYAEAAYDLTGPAGKIYSDQIKFRTSYSQQAMNAFLSGKFPDGNTLPDGCMLVGTKVKSLCDKNINIVKGKDGQPIMGRPTIEMDGKRVQINKGLQNEVQGIKTVMNQTDSKYAENVKNAIVDSEPVLLSPQQADAYRRATTEREKSAIIMDAQKSGMHGLIKRPELSSEQAEAVREHEKYRELVMAKYREMRPDEQYKMAASVYSISSIKLFLEDEKINEKVSKNEREYHSHGNNFERAELENTDFADGISDEDMRKIDQYAANLDNEMAILENPVDCTGELGADGLFTVITGDGQTQETIIQDHDMQEHDSMGIGAVFGYEDTRMS